MMRSKNILIVELFFIALILSGPLSAKPQTTSGDTLLVPKASYFPKIDGELDEIWYNVTKTRNLTYVQGTEPADWLDLFFWFRVMWDDTYFYMFVTVFDDEINTNNSNVWERDGFEVYFDGDNSKNSMEVGYDANDIQLRWVYGEASGNPGTAHAIHAFKSTDFGYNFELAIPVNELPFNFEPGHVFGFDLQCNDNDGNSRQHVGKWWSSSDDNWRNPSLFGTAKLIDREVSNILDINRTAFSPVIDGVMDDLWNYVPEISNNKYFNYNNRDYDDFEDWDDLVCNFRTMWDQANFYFFAKVWDNDRNTSSSTPSENDCIKIYFDGDNSKTQSYDSDDVQYRWVYKDNSGIPVTPHSIHAWQDTDDGYNFELQIPVADLPFTFEEGHILGFEFQVNDNDYGVLTKKAKWWSENDNSWLDPSLFGTAKLVNKATSQNMHVIITSPQPEASFVAGTDIPVTAEVTILEGTIAKVEFFANEVKIGEDVSSPYNIIWQNVSEGNYTLYVTATDDQDRKATSASVRITVKAAQAEVPEFSVGRGFCETSFDVIVHSQTPNATIKYTLDGSDPRSSPTAIMRTSPATIRIDPESTAGQRGKTPGVILRACALAPGYSVSEPVTHTYLFVNKVATLSPDGVKPGPGWPNPTRSANPQFIDYGMDPDVLNDPRYKDLIDDALLAIPTVSLATDLKHLFAPDSGIYMNALKEGRAWERPASIELLHPDGREGFQINAGIRIRGGWSGHGDNPKHAFRLFFRKEYGKGKLEYPLFEDEGVDEFDKVDLRTSQNYSWSYPGHQGEYNIMIRDVFSRDLQREMGQPYTRSRFYHLYINGVYWGLFQSQERSEARYAVSYFGGTVEDYDVIKPSGDLRYVIEATDGNLDAYREIWNLCNSGFRTNTNYFKLQGLNPDGTRNPAYKVLVDIDNLIDFMVVIFYAGNFDSPTTKFGSNKNPNNFFCIYNRNGNDGFKFFAHDAEHTLRTTAGEGPGVGLYENRVNIGNLSDGYKMVVSDFSKFHPQWLHFKLSENAEYRLRFADHVYKHFFNQGCMTPEKAKVLFLSRAKEIELAIIGESARWGDTYHHPPRTKDDDWQVAIDDIVDNYFPYRTGIVLNQLKEVGLYPNINPPVFKNNNQEILENRLKVGAGYKLKMVNPNNPNGTIQYTVDGNDPRIIGGNTASSAKDGGDDVEITVNATTVIKARVQEGATWSALHEIILFVDDKVTDLKTTEIHYHPLDGVGVSDNEYEFLELKNIGATPIDLSLAFFEDGITYTFPFGTIINPNEFIVLASNQQEFNNRYGFLPFGEYSGQLDNGGERITLCTALNDTLFSIRYDDQAPWPESPDGGGFSLVTKEPNPTGDLNDPANWRASAAIHGSPGQHDPASTAIEPSVTGFPTNFALNQNYPNPFNPSTTISYQLPESREVTLEIYNIQGQKVRTLVNEKQATGFYKIQWDGLDDEGQLVTNGIYFYQLKASTQGRTQTSSKKMIFLK